LKKSFLGPANLVFHPDTGLRQFPCRAGFLVMAMKKNSELDDGWLSHPLSNPYE
jgi:hypothetical protein